MTATLATTVRTLRTRIIALLAVGALGLAAGLVAVSPAQAEPKGGPTGGTGSCPIEIDGKTTTVPEGTRVGIWVCGHDGNWHFGWLITNAARGASPSHGVRPIISVNSATELLPAVQHS